MQASKANESVSEYSKTGLCITVKAACLAPRGDVQHDTYYNYESEDDTEFDMIAEMDEPQYHSTCADTIDNFDNRMFDEQFDYFGARR